jgi:hypothetical protein
METIEEKEEELEKHINTCVIFFFSSRENK